MSANRHLGRIIALQTLYEQEFRSESADESLDLDEVLERNIARYEDTLDDRKFVVDLVHGVDQNTQQLDKLLSPLAPEWPIDQIARMDRMTLRIGLYEVMQNDVPPKVVINEAVELAKAFGSDNSSKFVNGVLGTALKQKESGKLKLK